MRWLDLLLAVPTMLAKPGEEIGLYKRQSIHAKTGIVAGAGGVLKKGPPRWSCSLAWLVCARSSPKAKQHACSSVLGLVLQKTLALMLHVSKCMLYQPKRLGCFPAKSRLSANFQPTLSAKLFG